MASRSRSRGREPVFSSGRGGAGNIRPISKDPGSRERGPDDYSHSRGREIPVGTEGYTHSGRGGAGNVRSPSRDADGNRKAAKEVNEYARAHHDPHAPVSTGRGGIGNIDRSRSRSKEPGRVSAAPVHTYGHGGAGNVAPGATHGDGYLKSVEENEARAYHQDDAIHSTGRGGAGNVTATHAPSKATEAAELHAYHKDGAAVSSGRGGAGNIY